MNLIYCETNLVLDFLESALYCDCLKFNNTYDIKEEDDLRAISNWIYEIYKDDFAITEDEFYELICNVIKNKQTYYIHLYSDVKDSKELVYIETNGIKKYQEYLKILPDQDNLIKCTYYCFDKNSRDLHGLIEDYYCDYRFYKIQYEDNDICYTVIENYTDVYDYVPSIERMFSEYFETLEEAEDFAKELKIKIANKRKKYKNNIDLVLDSVVSLMPDSKKRLRQSMWYQLQVEAIRLLKEKNIDIYDDNTFCVDINEHIKILKQL